MHVHETRCMQTECKESDHSSTWAGKTSCQSLTVSDVRNGAREQLQATLKLN
jgi:hypothetical protein